MNRVRARSGMPARAVALAAGLVLLLSAHTTHATCPMSGAWGGGGDAGAAGARRSLQVAPGSAASISAAGSVCHKDVDYVALKKDIKHLLTDSQPFWPADYGHYGPFFIRMAWHCSGTYRHWDGRGGCDGGRQVFNPELSWPDNTNLIKAHTLLQPMKIKYGPGLSWGDLIVLAGTVAIEDMGGPVLGFCAGRVDDEDGVGSEALTDQALWPCPLNGNCSGPMGQSVMGNIYVDPAGHMGHPDPSGPIIEDIRRTFGNMGMNDTETVALIGAHAFGKTHGACPTGPGPNPKEDPLNPYPGTCGSGPEKGKGKNAFTSGFEGPWTTTPTKWDNQYFTSLVQYDWVLEQSPGGSPQWRPKAKKGAASDVPNIMMLTSDVALTKDPQYLEIVETFAKDPAALSAAFAAAWYKLVTRDMGPASRCKGPWVPPPQPFQNPLPPPNHGNVDYDKVREEVGKLLYGASIKSPILEPDMSTGGAYYGALFSELAWRCASTFRATDYRGGCNGAFIRLAPQKHWKANEGMDKVMEVLGDVKEAFPHLSWADLIVLAGSTAVESAAGHATQAGGGSAKEGEGHRVEFCGYRVDALHKGEGLNHLEPRTLSSLVVQVQDDAKVAGLTVREAVALAGRLRSPSQQRRLGYSGAYNTRETLDQLSNEYFVKLMKYDWVLQNSTAGVAEYTAVDEESGTAMYMTPADLALKASPPMWAVALQYAGDEELFHREFVAAWSKVMNADRFGARCK